MEILNINESKKTTLTIQISNNSLIFLSWWSLLKQFKTNTLLLLIVSKEQLNDLYLSCTVLSKIMCATACFHIGLFKLQYLLLTSLMMSIKTSFLCLSRLFREILNIVNIKRQWKSKWHCVIKAASYSNREKSYEIEYFDLWIVMRILLQTKY